MTVKRRAVLVLGMHRSGTSMISKALMALGYCVGENLMPPSKDNQKGYWEDSDVVSCNDRILQRQSAAWDIPFTLKAEQSVPSEGLAEIKGLLREKFSAHSKVALKDPRMSLLGPLWLQAFQDLGYQVSVIVCLRHPGDVANSLLIRDGFEAAKSLVLWERYTLSALNVRANVVALVQYERMLSRPTEELVRIAKLIGDEDELPDLQQGIDEFAREFVDKSLCHNQYGGAFFSEELEELWLELEACAGNGALDQVTLSRLNALSEKSQEKYSSSRAQVIMDELVLALSSVGILKDKCESLQREVEIAVDIRNVTAESNQSITAALSATERSNQLLTSALAAAEQSNQSLMSTVTTLREQQESLLGENSELRQHATNLENNLLALKNSSSWKITAPMRTFATQARKVGLAVKGGYRYAKTRGLRQSIVKSIAIYNREGLRGIKQRLRASAQVVPNVVLGHPQVQGFPLLEIHQGDNSSYSLRKGGGGYVYMPPRKPADFNERVEALRTKPFFSIVVPVYNTPLSLLELMVESVKNQWYQHWELILVDDASPATSVKQALQTLEGAAVKVTYLDDNRGIAGATNVGLSVAAGDYVVFLDHDDELTADCLYELAVCIDENAADFIYSDEDKISEEGKFTEPHFKPQWSPDTMMSTMYTCHVSCVKMELVRELGGLRSEYDGCQDWDFVLRVSEVARKICHIPKVLYHWRIIPQSIASGLAAKDYAIEASKKVRLDAAKRRGFEAEMKAVEQVPGYFRIQYAVKGEPLVSIIIPTRDNGKVLRACIKSIKEKTTYLRYELIILDNGSVEPSTVDYLNELSGESDTKVIRHDHPFNYSELNNLGVTNAAGDFLLFLNDDTEVISEDWLQSMIGYAQLPHVGAVGAKLLYPNTNKIQHVGVLNLENGPGHAFLKQDADLPGYYMRSLLDYNWLAVTGACLMVERAKFAAVGGFCESFPIAYNDVDLCMKLVEHNLFNVVNPSVRLIHHESISRGVDDISAEKIQRLKNERRRLFEAHPAFYQADPFFSPNLHPNGINFEVVS